MTQKQMKLGASIRGLGYNSSVWRHPDVRPDASESFEHFAECALIAEKAKFDTVFFADGVALRAEDKPAGSLAHSHENVELEPLTLLAALATVTKHIGLVATASTSYNEPYHIARKFASIDHISGGRAGWNAVTSWSELEALNFSREAHYEHDLRYERAAEFVEVVTGLWDSWDEDAFIRDKKSGIFFDQAKMHVLNHRGTFFKVRGPLTASRSRQGRPLIFQAGASDKGMDLAARFADAVYSVPHTWEESCKFRDELRRRTVSFGRRADDIKVLPGIQIVVGRTEKEAQEKLQLLRNIVDPMSGMARLFAHYGDMTGFELDEPVPPDLQKGGKVSTAGSMIRKAVAEGWTMRRLFQEVGIGLQRQLVGTPEHVADDLQLWFEKGACDGFNIIPSHLPAGLRDVAEMVVPVLQNRGLFRTEYEGTTLRDRMGLDKPRSRYEPVAKQVKG